MPNGDDGHLLLLSDVHARYDVIAAQLDHARNDLGQPVARVVVAGDFGLFAPEMHRYFRRGGHRFSAPVSFIEGNHEDYRNLGALVGAYADVVTHLPRATVQPLGRWRALCLGGARYMDAWSTPRGCEITDRDIAACLSFPADDVDLVISHDCPCGIGVPSNAGLEHLGPPGVPGLDSVAARLRPQLWFFGHHHRWHLHERDGTRYIGLPESWRGYSLLAPDGQLRHVEHTVAVDGRPRWRRVFGLR